MQKNKKFNRFAVAVLVFAMMAMYGSVPSVLASTLSNAKDTLSTSAPSVVATHTVSFGTSIAIPGSGTIEVTLTGFASAPANITCPGAGGASSTVSNTAICTYGGGLATTSSNTMTFTATNPTPGIYDVTIETKDGATVLESAGLKVAIVSQVQMSATVPATLTFSVAGTSTGATINGIAITATSTATTTPFGSLVAGNMASVGQTLAVSTNADNGYTVTVQEDQDLKNAAGATIDSFIEGSATSTPNAWVDAAGTLDQVNTYGHLAYSTDDSDLTINGADFTSGKYAGLSTTSPRTVMSHNGPANGTAQNQGLASVVYSVKVTALQEAGIYSNNLTYVCTPTY